MSEKNEAIEVGRLERHSISSSRLRTIRVIGTVLLLYLIFSIYHPGDLVSTVFAPRKTCLTGAAKVLSENPLIDGHNDLLILVRFAYHGHIYNDNFTQPFENGGFPLHFDLPRAKTGQVGGAFCEFNCCEGRLE